MGLTLLTERYAPQIAGMLSCWDRILLFGTLPKICYAEGMTSYLYERKIRIFDYPRFAEPFRNALRENAERLAADHGIEIEFLRKRNVRKEDRVKAVLAKRGEHPGLVCILSAMEPCSTYKPWHNKNTGKTYLLPDDGKCLHYYFYFIDQELGLGYVRVPTCCRADCRSTSTDTVGWPACCASAKSTSSCWTMRWWKSPTGNVPSKSLTDWTSSGCTGDWMTWPSASVRYAGSLASPTTGAWTSANTPPTWFSESRRIWRPSTAT